MKFSKMIAVFAGALMVFSAHAAEDVLNKADVGKTVEVLYSEPTIATQVVVGDGRQSYLMVSAENVADTVLVTQEMANNAIPFNVTTDVFPKLTTVDQIPNAEQTEGTTTPFLKTGRMEVIVQNRVKINTVYFGYNGGVYSYDTVSEVPKTVTLTHELIARANKS